MIHEIWFGSSRSCYATRNQDLTASGSLLLGGPLLSKPFPGRPWKKVCFDFIPCDVAWIMEMPAGLLGLPVRVWVGDGEKTTCLSALAGLWFRLCSRKIGTSAFAMYASICEIFFVCFEGVALNCPPFSYWVVRRGRGSILIPFECAEFEFAGC